MSSVAYNSFKRNILNGIQLDQDDIRCILVNDTYVVDIDNHTTYSNVTSAEIAATGGYSTSGLSLSGKVLSADNVQDRSVFTANNVKWSNSSITAKGAILFKMGNTPQTSPLVTFVDFGRNYNSQSGDFEIAWSPTNGIMNFK